MTLHCSSDKMQWFKSAYNNQCIYNAGGFLIVSGLWKMAEHVSLLLSQLSDVLSE